MKKKKKMQNLLTCLIIWAGWSWLPFPATWSLQDTKIKKDSN